MDSVSLLDAPHNVALAIKKASKATGTAFDYLVRTAARESNFENDAESNNSSATGLFQFIDNTWLQAIKVDGPNFGLEQYSDKIKKSRNGRYFVPNASDKQEILNLRKDPEISSIIAGAYTKRNAEYMRSKTNREPNQSELYMAHFLGPKNASRLVRLAEVAPKENADRFFPDAAGSNRQIFYSRGRPRSVAQVYRILSHKHNESTPVAGLNNFANTKDVTEGPWKVEIIDERPIRDTQSVAHNLGNGLGRAKNPDEIGLWKTIVTARLDPDQLGQARPSNSIGNVEIHNLFRDPTSQPEKSEKSAENTNVGSTGRRTFKSANILHHLDMSDSMFRNLWSTTVKKS